MPEGCEPGKANRVNYFHFRLKTNIFYFTGVKNVVGSNEIVVANIDSSFGGGLEQN